MHKFKYAKDRFILKAELHIHSRTDVRLLFMPFLQESVQSVEEILDRAIRLGIEIIAITNHDSLDGYFKARRIIKDKKLGIILIPGCEISTKEGHILAYNITKEIPKGLSAKETIEKIHKQKGIAVAAHPHSFVFSLGDKIFDLDIDAIEGYNSLNFEKKDALALLAAKKKGVPCIAGSDSHQIDEIGRGLTLFPEGTKTTDDVITNIKNGNFRTQFSRTNKLKMGIKHLYKNIKGKINEFQRLFIERAHFSHRK